MQSRQRQHRHANTNNNERRILKTPKSQSPDVLLSEQQSHNGRVWDLVVPHSHQTHAHRHSTRTLMHAHGMGGAMFLSVPVRACTDFAHTPLPQML